MSNYLLSITFYAGSDDAEDIDRGLYLMRTDKEYSFDEMKNLFKTVNALLCPYREDIDENPFELSYDEGINIYTLTDGIKLFAKCDMIKIPNCCNEVGCIDAYYEIEQWQ